MKLKEKVLGHDRVRTLFNCVRLAVANYTISVKDSRRPTVSFHSILCGYRSFENEVTPCAILSNRN